MKKYIKPTISVVEVELESLMMQMSGEGFENLPSFDEDPEYPGGPVEARPFDIWDFEE